MLHQHRERVGEAVFTTYKEITMCNTMDQLQLVIDKLTGCKPEGGKKKSAFFQIKFLDVARDDSEEVMIQILDVSQRVLGQSLKTERKYLSIMNSTTSHEMRNPLNAISSNIDDQVSSCSKLKNILS